MDQPTQPAFLSPPRERGLPLAWLLIGLIALGLLGLQWARTAVAPQHGGRMATPAGPAAPPPPPVTSPPRVAPAAPQGADTPPGHTAVTRCVAGGRITFTDRDCPSGSQASTLQVQRDLNLADGAPHLPRARPAPLVVKSEDGGMAATAVDHRRNECATLEAAVAQYDADARHPTRRAGRRRIGSPNAAAVRVTGSSSWAADAALAGEKCVDRLKYRVDFMGRTAQCGAGSSAAPGRGAGFGHPSVPSRRRCLPPWRVAAGPVKDASPRRAAVPGRSQGLGLRRAGRPHSRI